MTLPGFIDLLSRYSQNDCTPNEVQLIDQWYEALRPELMPNLTAAERQLVKQYLWQRIERRLDQPELTTSQSETETPVVAIGQSGRGWLGQRAGWVAAAVVVLLGAGAWLLFPKKTDLPTQVAQKPVSAVLVTHWHNTTRTAQRIALADGSMVALQPNAELRTSATQTRREAWLRGRAFFDISKDPRRPFMVYTGAVVTRVLGTSFWIDAPQNQTAVKVAVRTGRVWVSEVALGREKTASSVADGVVLVPNEQVRFDADSHRLVVGLVAEPHLLPVADEPSVVSLSFDNQLVIDVLADLQTQYGIIIVPNRETLKNCRFTGDISQQSLYTQLDLVCRAVGADYTIIGTRIVVSGTGCTTP